MITEDSLESVTDKKSLFYMNFSTNKDFEWINSMQLLFL